ncbi:MAG: iron-containing alcohol dehydrogenase [Magnetococcales bacterium]|nr:iron-containing alcohol dehydrogenase [Magnetococcales bacterium]
MENFDYFNPVRILFGEGQIARLPSLIPTGARILLTAGGGSIRTNGVFEQVTRALTGFSRTDFFGIEANPLFETCLEAAALCRREKIDFLLAVGGGSVLDATKLIAAATHFDGDPWDLVSREAAPGRTLPLGTVLTLPATGSEMNAFSVISRAATGEKLGFGSPELYPRFAILDPRTTLSLPPRQVANGIVDTFVHVTEQYLTRPADAPLQDRQAEAILLTLVDEAPKVRANPDHLPTRANLMWCATQALNGLIGCGVPQDWSTHMIGHELTAFFGLDHGQSLAVVLPGVLELLFPEKSAKLAQFGERVWGIREVNATARARAAIARTEAFFQEVGVATRLGDYGIGSEAADKVAARFAARGVAHGESGQVDAEMARKILLSRL